jgi:ADP-heptose:LPS heptosyltransferase
LDTWIVHAAALGDFVLTWPLALALQRLYGPAVSYVTHHSKGKLAQRFLGTGFRDVQSAGPPEGTRVYSFMGTPGAVQLRSRPEAGYGQHITRFYAEQLADADLRQAYEAVLGELEVGGLARPSGEQVLLHVGSGSVRKNWPLENHLELARQLQPAHPVAFVAGEAELERLSPAELDRLRACAPVHVPEDYLALADLLLGSSTLVSADNGPGHLAGILGLRVISLFGATSPIVWRPLGPRVRVIAGPDVHAISVGGVLGAMAK